MIILVLAMVGVVAYAFKQARDATCAPGGDVRDVVPDAVCADPMVLVPDAAWPLLGGVAALWWLRRRDAWWNR